MLTQLKDYQGKKILVTGHTGFKGAWLSRALVLAGAEVYGVALEPETGSLFTRIENIGFKESTFTDIRNAAALNEYLEKHTFDGVFHLAAQPLVIKSYEEPLETFATNVMGTANLLQSIMMNKSSPWTVVVTTDKVYKNVEKLAGYTEDESLGGKDPYSASKAATEMVVSAWQNLGALQNPIYKLVAVRAGNVIGGGDIAENRLIPDLIRGFLSNSKTVIRFPHSIRPWQHVLDPLNGYLTLGCKLMADKKISPAYNFGPGDESKLNVESMAKVACSIWEGTSGYVIKSEPNPPPESVLLWLSSERANHDLGWKNKLDAFAAIKWTIDWERKSRETDAQTAIDSQIKDYFEGAS
jgi:CDP-glucose 4,6-dehydratase